MKNLFSKYYNLPLEYKFYGTIFISVILYFLLIPISKPLINSDSKKFTISDDSLFYNMRNDKYISDFVGLNSISQLFNFKDDKFIVNVTNIGNKMVGQIHMNDIPYCYIRNSDEYYYSYRQNIDIKLHFYTKDKIKIKTISTRLWGYKLVELNKNFYNKSLIIDFEDLDENNNDIYDKIKYFSFEIEKWCKN